MKFLKYLLLFLLVVIVGLVIYSVVQPNEYDFNRSRTIKAPAELVYNQVDDYKLWEEWGPWNEQDPTIVATYAEKTKGPGASYTWTGADGDGKATRVESVPYKSLSDELDFGSMGVATTYWQFEPKDGATEVTWGMKAKDLPFMLKFFGAISGGYENMMGPMFERGLEKLDSVAMLKAKENETLMNTFTISDVSQKNEGVFKFIGYAHTSKIDSDKEAMQEIYMESMPKAGEFAMENDLEYGEFIPGTVYTKWDEETGVADFIVGILLKKDLKAGQDMKTITIPAGNRVSISKFGNYGLGNQEARNAIMAYISSNNLKVTGPHYELYVNDPTTVATNEIQTDIYYPVK